MFAADVIEAQVALSRGRVWARKIRRPCWAEDISQEIRIALWRRAGEWRGQGGYAAWCRNVADSRACDLIRSWKRQKRGCLVDWRPLQPADRIGAQNHDALLVEQLLRSLPLNRRQLSAVRRYRAETDFSSYRSK